MKNLPFSASSILAILIAFLFCFQCTKENHDALPKTNADPLINAAHEHWTSTQIQDRSEDGFDLILDWDLAKVRFSSDSMLFVLVPVVETEDSVSIDMIFYQDSCGFSEEIWAYKSSNTFINPNQDDIVNGIVLVVNFCHESALAFRITDTMEVEYFILDFDELEEVKEDSLLIATDRIYNKKVDWEAEIDKLGGGAGWGGWGSPNPGIGGNLGGVGAVGNSGRGGTSWSGLGGWNNSNEGGNNNPAYDPYANHPFLNGGNANPNIPIMPFLAWLNPLPEQLTFLLEDDRWEDFLPFADKKGWNNTTKSTIKIYLSLHLADKLPLDSNDSETIQILSAFPETASAGGGGGPWHLSWVFAVNVEKAKLRYWNNKKPINERRTETQLDLDSYYNVFLEAVHTGLDVAGLVPAIGEVADITNGIIYYCEGDALNSTLSVTSAIPFAGWFATGAKFSKKVINVAGNKCTLNWLKDSAGKVTFGNRDQLKTIIKPPANHQAHHIIPWASKDHLMV